MLRCMRARAFRGNAGICRPWFKVWLHAVIFFCEPCRQTARICIRFTPPAGIRCAAIKIAWDCSVRFYPLYKNYFSNPASIGSLQPHNREDRAAEAHTLSFPSAIQSSRSISQSMAPLHPQQCASIPLHCALVPVFAGDARARIKIVLRDEYAIADRKYEYNA